MSIDIVIVNWNAGNLLLRCVQSIMQTMGCSLVQNIIIVDNASTDESLKLLPKNDNITVVKNSENKGFAFACNQGINLCKSDYVVMLNPDVKLYPETLNESIQYMETHKEVDIMGCMQINEQGKIAPSCSRFPTPFRFWGDALGLSKMLPNIFKPATLMTDWDHQTSSFVDQIMGSYMFIRKSVFSQIGLFDTRFFVYYEELDLSKRLATQGGKSFYNHTIQLLHTGEGTTESVKPFRLFLSINSRLLYSKKHFSFLGHISTFVSSLFLEPFTRMLFSFFKEGFSGLQNTLKAYKMVWSRWLLLKK